MHWGQYFYLFIKDAMEIDEQEEFLEGQSMKMICEIQGPISASCDIFAIYKGIPTRYVWIFICKGSPTAWKHSPTAGGVVMTSWLGSILWDRPTKNYNRGMKDLVKVKCFPSEVPSMIP